MVGAALQTGEVQDTGFQEREWTAQRVGWALMGAFVDLDEMTVDGVTPEPDTVTAIGGRVHYTSAAEPSDGPLTVAFDITPDGMGYQHAEVAVADGTERLRFGQFVYP